MARCQTQTDTKPIAICSEILVFLCTYTLPHMHVQLRLNFSSRALLKSLRVAVCHAAKSIVLSFAAQWISVSGRCWEGKALERNWSLGRTDTKPIQDRYESGVCCANPCKTDTGKKLVGGPSAPQQYPRLTESVPNKSASSYVFWGRGLKFRFNFS